MLMLTALHTGKFTTTHEHPQMIVAEAALSSSNSFLQHAFSIIELLHLDLDFRQVTQSPKSPRMLLAEVAFPCVIHFSHIVLGLDDVFGSQHGHCQIHFRANNLL